MTLRTGKGVQYRYYTCSTKARQGEIGCKGRTVTMDKLDTSSPITSSSASYSPRVSKSSLRPTSRPRHG